MAEETVDIERPARKIIHDPPFLVALFNDTRWSFIWLPVRGYLAYEWIHAGLHKITGTGWMDGGAALQGFWTKMTATPPSGSPPIAFDWYRSFLHFMLVHQTYIWFAKLIAIGELTVGIALVLGAFSGIAAFTGAFLNWNFMMAGSASTNPVLFVLAILLVLGWKTAGYIGLDRWLLPLIGTPWEPGTLFDRRQRRARRLERGEEAAGGD